MPAMKRLLSICRLPLASKSEWFSLRVLHALRLTGIMVSLAAAEAAMWNPGQRGPAMLTRLRVTGYKSFRDATLSAGPLCVLVGPNASGKSNLFRTLCGCSPRG